MLREISANFPMNPANHFWNDSFSYKDISNAVNINYYMNKTPIVRSKSKYEYDSDSVSDLNLKNINSSFCLDISTIFLLVLLNIKRLSSNGLKPSAGGHLG